MIFLGKTYGYFFYSLHIITQRLQLLDLLIGTEAIKSTLPELIMRLLRDKPQRDCITFLQNRINEFKAAYII